MDVRITGIINEKYIPKLEEQKLIEKGDAAALLLEIEEPNPIDYIKRLILCASSGQEINGKKIDEIKDLNDITDYEYCDLFISIKKENVKGKEIKLKPNETFKVPDGPGGVGFLRDLFGSPNSYDVRAIFRTDRRTENDCEYLRKVAFSLAFVLNLTKDQFLKLLLQEFGLANINYKDPYEVLFMYTITKHENMYETYSSLCRMYEQYCNERIPVKNEDRRTAEYRKDYENLFEKSINIKDENTEQRLIEFVASLPKEPSISFNNEFIRLYDNIFDSEIESIVLDKFAENSKSLDDEADVNCLIKTIIRESYNNKVVRSCFKDRDVLNQIFGGKKRENLKVQIAEILNDRAYINPKKVENIRMGKANATRENIIVLAFYNFSLGIDKEYDYWECLDGCDKNNNALVKIYTYFKEYCDKIFGSVGSVGLYLPNPVERVVTFCLLTNDPLKTFKYLMNRE